MDCFEFRAAFLIRTHRELSIPQGFSVWFGDWSAQKVSNVDGHISIFQKIRDLEHRTAYVDDLGEVDKLLGDSAADSAIARDVPDRPHAPLVMI